MTIFPTTNMYLVMGDDGQPPITSMTAQDRTRRSGTSKITGRRGPVLTANQAGSSNSANIPMFATLRPS